MKRVNGFKSFTANSAARESGGFAQNFDNLKSGYFTSFVLTGGSKLLTGL